MRFSDAFTRSLRVVRRPQVPVKAPAPPDTEQNLLPPLEPDATAGEPPLDLDQRVRLAGEW